jgi:hypothetical protein
MWIIFSSTISNSPQKPSPLFFGTSPSCLCYNVLRYSSLFPSPLQKNVNLYFFPLKMLSTKFCNKCWQSQYHFSKPHAPTLAAALNHTSFAPHRLNITCVCCKSILAAHKIRRINPNKTLFVKGLIRQCIGQCISSK